MGKAKVLGQFKPSIPNAKAAGKHGRKAPWQGAKKKHKKESNPVKLILFDEFETDPERKKQGGAFYAE